MRMWRILRRVANTKDIALNAANMDIMSQYVGATKMGMLGKVDAHFLVHATIAERRVIGLLSVLNI